MMTRKGGKLTGSLERKCNEKMHGEGDIAIMNFDGNFGIRLRNENVTTLRHKAIMKN